MAVAAIHQHSPLLRWLLLVLLVVQTSLMVLLLRYSRTANTSVPYLGSTVVFFTEVVKLLLCLVLLLWQRHCSPALAATVFLNEVKSAVRIDTEMYLKHFCRYFSVCR